MASSNSKTGSDRGSSWTAKLTCPRRLPNRVPVTLRPREGVTESWVGMLSHLHVGRIILGKAIMLRSERTSEVNLEWTLFKRCTETGECEPLVIRSLPEHSSFSGIDDETEVDLLKFEDGVILFELLLVQVLVVRCRATSCLIVSKEIWWWRWREACAWVCVLCVILLLEAFARNTRDTDRERERREMKGNSGRQTWW